MVFRQLTLFFLRAAGCAYAFVTRVFFGGAMILPPRASAAVAAAITLIFFRCRPPAMAVPLTMMPPLTRLPRAAATRYA